MVDEAYSMAGEDGNGRELMMLIGQLDTIGVPTLAAGVGLPHPAGERASLTRMWHPAPIRREFGSSTGEHSRRRIIRRGTFGGEVLAELHTTSGTDN